MDSMSRLPSTSLFGTRQPAFGSVQLTIKKSTPQTRSLLAGWVDHFSNGQTLAELETPTGQPGKSVLHVVGTSSDEQDVFQQLVDGAVHHRTIMGNFTIQRLETVSEEEAATKHSPPFVKTMRARFEEKQQKLAKVFV
jgi:hypothetical protein